MLKDFFLLREICENAQILWLSKIISVLILFMKQKNNTCLICLFFYKFINIGGAI